MSRQQVAVPLKEVFEMKNWSKRLKLTVKILKKLSENEFLVADSTISCKIKIDNLKPIYIAKSSVFNIPKFEKVHDGVKPFLPSPSLPGQVCPDQICPAIFAPNPNLPGPIFAPNQICPAPYLPQTKFARSHICPSQICPVPYLPQTKFGTFLHDKEKLGISFHNTQCIKIRKKVQFDEI